MAVQSKRPSLFRDQYSFRPAAGFLVPAATSAEYPQYLENARGAPAYDAGTVIVEHALAGSTARRTFFFPRMEAESSKEPIWSDCR